jgi:translation elongation factor EF-Ts
LKQVRPERAGPKEEIEMRLVDNLRKAEEKGVMSIRRSMERARDEWSDVERRIRQRMRIYPHKQKAAVAGAGQTNLERDVPEQSSGEARKPIVSIHGHDL